MIGYIANTHADWFDYLASRGGWEEVNFWSPSAYYAFRGAPGSPLFFRLKAPRNAIGGFGIVSGFARMPEWLAWECFGAGNGAPTLQAMQARLAAIRSQNGIANDGPLQQIGCIMLANAVFFPPEDWVRQPSDWGRQNLRYKSYAMELGEGERIWRECQERAARLMPLAAHEPQITDSEPRHGTPTLITPRLGQGAFRIAVTEAYGRACAVTQEHSLPALEAAHIVPFSMDGPHRVNNGLLLRSDLHRLFDRGYVTVTNDCRLHVSRHLREHFSNGKSYYPLHGTPLTIPAAINLKPDPQLLSWHNEHRFLG